MFMPRLFVIIPVHNRRVLTRDCLFSLGKQTVKDFEIIVVDDGSTDGTEEMIKKDFPGVTLLRGDGNLWWSGAMNLGIKYAAEHGADYILSLNDDTKATGDFIEKMLYWADKKSDSLFGAFALDVNTQKPVYCGEIINWKMAQSTFLLSKTGPDKQHGILEVTHFHGRGLLIPIKAIQKIGVFDSKHFPQTFADLDFTHRALRAGFKIYCNCDARLLIYPEKSGAVQLINNKSWKNYYLHLFSIKGGGDLGRFVIYAFRNSPKKYLLPFMIIGLLRRVFGYLYHWLLKREKRREDQNA